MAQITSSSSDSFVFKFEYKGKPYELKNLTANDTVADLRAVICTMLGINNNNSIALKSLQPTKVIKQEEDLNKLSSIFNQRREKIVVEDVEESPSTSRGIKNERVPSYSGSPIQPSTKHHKGETSATNQENRAPSPQSPSLMIGPQNKNHQQHDTNEFPVCSSTGYLLRHPVPSNNSCLFIAVHFCLTGGIVDDKIGRSMRKIIADTVASDLERFDDAFLGKTNSEYCKWILNDNHWGGAIELSILCKYYQTEIVAIDVKNLFMTRFGEDNNYPKRMLLLYDGLHYDPLKFQPLDDSQEVLTLFSTENSEVLNLAEELAKEAKQSHQFTDLNDLTLKCSECNAELNSKTASEHATITGHIKFTELH